MLRRNLTALVVCSLVITVLVYLALPGGDHTHTVSQSRTWRETPNSSSKNVSSSNKQVFQYNYDIQPPKINRSINDWPRVIILTPVKNAAKHLDKYFENLKRLNYPKHLTSIAFLTSDSDDGTYEKLEAKLEAVRHEYRYITHFVKNFNYELSNSNRHGWQAQIPRRKVMSMSRNFLLTAVRDEDWVVWWDVDVITFPATIIEDLIRRDKDIIQPNCYMKTDSGEDYPYDLNVWVETPESIEFQKDKKEDDILVEGYPDTMWTHRLYLNDFRGKALDIIELDGVGGTFLLVRADVHRAGANFPAFPVKHQLETEGFAKMAKLMGFKIYGLPDYIIYHHS